MIGLSIWWHFLHFLRLWTLGTLGVYLLGRQGLHTNSRLTPQETRLRNMTSPLAPHNVLQDLWCRAKVNCHCLYSRHGWPTSATAGERKLGDPYRHQALSYLDPQGDNYWTSGCRSSKYLTVQKIPPNTLPIIYQNAGPSYMAHRPRGIIATTAFRATIQESDILRGT